MDVQGRTMKRLKYFYIIYKLLKEEALLSKSFKDLKWEIEDPVLFIRGMIARHEFLEGYTKGFKDVSAFSNSKEFPYNY